MLDDLHVRDFYVPITDYPHIPASASICDAIQMMHNSLSEGHKYRTILVTDANQHLQGYLSLRDLTRAVGPKFLRKEAPDYKGHQPFQGISDDFTALSLIWQEGFTLKILEEARKPVSGVLTLIKNTVSLNDPFAKCAYLLLVEDVLILPVVEDNKVIGVVRLVDIFERFADTVCARKKLHAASGTEDER
ncbi:MAG: CBS domain-containing protein [Gammaproteobacteria bacterium]|nr:CBS domain-containing protein [Gammaproteobacteria bacterium]MDH3561183.1 CBS domain-containing protein [Gammaproteobacteria bacterium]